MVGDDQRDQQDGFVLGLALQTADEEDDEVRVEDHLCAEDGLVDKEL